MTVHLTYKTDWDTRTTHFDSIPGAVEHALTPAPYSYEGDLERTKGRIELQTRMLSRLVEALHDAGTIDDTVLVHLLNGPYTVEPVRKHM